jgi:hypothetical protein
MNVHTGKTEKNQSKAAANNLSENQYSNASAFQFANNRTETNAQRELQTMGNHRPHLKQSIAQMPSIAPVQRMTKRGGVAASVMQADKIAKHVVATAGQQAHANATFGNVTMVTNAAAVTGVVDADAHNFIEAPAVRSDRHDIQANVAGVSVYEKSPHFPGEGSPSACTVNNQNTLCEIGVVKKGDDTVSVTHFQSA